MNKITAICTRVGAFCRTVFILHKMQNSKAGCFVWYVELFCRGNGNKVLGTGTVRGHISVEIPPFSCYNDSTERLML